MYTPLHPLAARHSNIPITKSRSQRHGLLYYIVLAKTTHKLTHPKKVHSNTFQRGIIL